VSLLFFNWISITADSFPIIRGTFSKCLLLKFNFLAVSARKRITSAISGEVMVANSNLNLLYNRLSTEVFYVDLKLVDVVACFDRDTQRQRY